MEKISRNDVCPCGSGKKYKHCCMQGNSSATPQVTSANPLPRLPETPIVEEINQLVASFNARRFFDMENGARALLARLPQSPIGWKALGTALLEQNKDALPALQQASRLMPNDAETLNNLGNVLQIRGRSQEAIACYRGALKIAPEFAEALCGLGGVFSNVGQLDEAIACCRHALLLKPAYTMALCNLGNALRERSEFGDAQKHYLHAFATAPEFAIVHNSYGELQLQLEQLEEAESSFRNAIRLKPDFPSAHNNLGNLLRKTGRLHEAMESYRQAIAHQSDFAIAYNNLGNVLCDVGNYGSALTNFQRAFILQPELFEASLNLGIVLREFGHTDKALQHLRNAVQINPKHAAVYCCIGNILLDHGQFDEAIAYNLQAIAREPGLIELHSNYLMSLQYVPKLSREDIFSKHREVGSRFEHALRPQWPIHVINNRSPDKRLKIGYVSGDFRKHAVAFFIEPVFVERDTSQVDIFCYSNSPAEDGITQGLIASIDHWRPCHGMTDDQLAQQILADGIDILVDLAGHSGRNRLLTFARKPAPIQVTYLGYPSGTGLTAIDYRLTDRSAEPESDLDAADHYYTEKLFRLPDSLWCYKPAADMPEITHLPALANGYLTFGSFNNVNKIDMDCVVLWSNLLKGLPTSRLAIATVPEGGVRTRLQRQFSEQGIDSSRIDFYGKLPPHEFQQKLQQMDVTLDPVNVNGATTTCESLWLGVPVLTLVGERFLQRAGLSVLSAAQLTEFAATSEEEFIAIAKRFAADLPGLAAIRAGLREHLRNSPLLDQKRYTRNLEQAYRTMWHRYLAQ
jgi:predicted O-linked N-acetylglucosamine transferase (SPINDLY family)